MSIARPSYLDRYEAAYFQGMRLGEKANPAQVRVNPAIVVADDDYYFSMGLQQELELKGYRAVATEDAEAIEPLIMKYHPEVVVLDHYMRRKTGAQILEELINKNLVDESDVILMSGMPTVAEIAEQLGVAFIEKPFESEDLMLLVEEATRVRGLMTV
jgi:DNA-binding NtrC family response regulator